MKRDQIIKEIAKLEEQLTLRPGQVWCIVASKVEYYIVIPKEGKLVLLNPESGSLWANEGFGHSEECFEYVGMIKDLYEGTGD